MMVMPETQVSQAERCRVIAERVMGLSVVMGEVDGVRVEKPYQWPFARTTRGGLAEIPDYFTDPAAMVEVMEKLPTFERMARGDDGNTQVWLCVANQIAYVGYTPMEAVAEAAYQWSVASVTPPADASSSSAP